MIEDSIQLYSQYDIGHDDFPLDPHQSQGPSSIQRQEGCESSQEKMFKNIEESAPELYKMHMESSLSQESGAKNAFLSTGASNSLNEDDQNIVGVQTPPSPQDNANAPITSPQNNNFSGNLADLSTYDFAQLLTNLQNNNNSFGQLDGFQDNKYVQYIAYPSENPFTHHIINPQDNNYAQHIVDPQHNNHIEQFADFQINNFLQHAADPQGTHSQNSTAAKRTARAHRESPRKGQNRMKNLPGTLIAKVQTLCQREDTGDNTDLFFEATWFMSPKEIEKFREWTQTYQKDYKTWRSILEWVKTNERFGDTFLYTIVQFLSTDFEIQYNASISEGHQMSQENRELLRRPETKELFSYKFGLVRQALGGQIGIEDFEKRIRTSNLDNFQNEIGRGREYFLECAVDEVSKKGSYGPMGELY